MTTPAPRNKKKLVLSVVCLTVVVLLTVVWIFLAVVQTHKNRRYGYDRYTGYTITRYVARRGLSDSYMENTAEAFISACESGFFFGVEADIRRTKDGVWVCSRVDDPFQDKSVKISRSTYDEIKDLPLDRSIAGENANADFPYAIATYELYLDILSNYGKTAFINVNDAFSAEELAPVVERALQTCGYEHLTFCGSSLKNAEAIKTCDPYVRTMLFGDSAFLAFTYTMMGRHVAVRASALTRQAIERAHDKNLAVGVYDVTTKDQADAWKELRVDYVFVNAPLS